MNKGFWIPITAALGLSYTAGEWDIYEANAKEIQHSEVFEAKLSQSSKTHAAAIVNDDLCPVIKDGLGLAAGACTAQKVIARGRGLTIGDDADGDPSVRVRLTLPALAVISMPE